VNNELSRDNTKPMRLAILVSIISSALSAFLLLRLNGIVHGQLYSFGLQFSTLWASPYWMTEALIYGCLTVPPAVGGSILVIDIARARAAKRIPTVKRVDAKPAADGAKLAASRPPMKTTHGGNPMLITCPKCKRVFGKPLNMLDFSRGPAQLVNVCPYCSYILGSSVDNDSDSTKVILPDKTEIEQK